MRVTRAEIDVLFERLAARMHRPDLHTTYNAAYGGWRIEDARGEYLFLERVPTHIFYHMLQFAHKVLDHARPG